MQGRRTRPAGAGGRATEQDRALAVGTMASGTPVGALGTRTAGAVTTNSVFLATDLGAPSHTPGCRLQLGGAVPRQRPQTLDDTNGRFG